jgi:glycerophosphoryl diester phosphodiesterase
MIVVAHRGDNQFAPENSLAAFASAIDKGADAIEFDVHWTKDKQLVVHHDYYLGRTEKGQGYIGDFTLAELKAFDIGSWFDPAFAQERIPTLQEVLALGKGQVRFEIELRCANRVFLAQVLSEIDQWQLVNDVEITTPHLPLLLYVRGTAHGLRKGIFFSPYPEWKENRLGQQHLLDWMRLADAQVAHLPYALIEPELVTKLHDHGFLVHVANLENAAEMESAIVQGIDQFSTDQLELARAVCDRIQPNAT